MKYTSYYSRDINIARNYFRLNTQAILGDADMTYFFDVRDEKHMMQKHGIIQALVANTLM